MKKNVLFAIVFISCFAHAQLRVINQPENNSATVTIRGVNTIDNDIIIAMMASASPYEDGVYISNGTYETLYQVNGLENVRHELKGIINEPYVMGNDAFILNSKFYNGTNTDKVYRINDTRTAANLVTSNDRKLFKTNNNKLVKYVKEFYPTSRENGVFRASGYFFDFFFYNADGTLETSYRLNGNTAINEINEDFNSLTNILKIFYWKGTYYFVGSNTQNRNDLYKIESGRFYRVTELFVTGNSNSATRPTDIVLDDNYMYFQGLYRTWGVNDNKSEFVNEGRELCYTNGSTTFGNSQTQIPLFILGASNLVFDGTRGYKAFDTSMGFADSTPIKEVNGNVIFFDNNFKSVNSLLPNGDNFTLIHQPSFAAFHFSYNDKVYYINFESEARTQTYLYELDGDPNNIKKYPFPDNSLGHYFSNARKDSFYISENEGKVFFTGSYHINSSIQSTGILSFDFSTGQFNQEASFNLNDVSSNLKSVVRYNNGFVFEDSDNVLSYNVEIRSKHITPNTDSAKQLANDKSTDDISYNGYVYTSDVSTSNLPLNEKIKIELLDTTSAHFNTKIVTYPDNSYAKTYYKMSSFNDLEHESTITLSYNDADFLNSISNPSDLSIQTYEAGNWIDLTVTSVDTTQKTFTLTHNFSANTLIFIRNNTTLSTKNSNFKDNVAIYPNPATSNLTINLKTGETIKTKSVYSLVGEQVFYDISNKNTMDVTMLSNGVYLLQIETQNGITYSKKIVKN